ncbi:MAG: hypothetical protein R2759_03530 [Bacteroidales bacterium]
MATSKEYDADEIGVLKLGMVPKKQLSAGDVGYIISGIKTSKEVKVGDTVTHVENPCKEAIAGFKNVKPMVLPGFIPLMRMTTRTCGPPSKSYNSTMRLSLLNRNRQRHLVLVSGVAF